MGSWRDVFVLMWRGAATLPAVQELDRAFARFTAHRPGGVAFIVVIEERAPVPESVARAAMAKMLRDHSAHIVGSTITLEGTGFRAAAVRSVLAGISMIVRPAYPHRVAATLADATDWLAESCASTGLAPFAGSELRQAIVDVRARHPAERLDRVG